DLHVVGRNKDANVAEVFQSSTFEAGQADRRGADITGDLQRFQNVRRVATATYAKGDVVRPNEISQLLSENVFVLRIVCPGGHERHAIRKRHYMETFSGAIHRTLPQIASEVRGQRGAAT